jgi:type II secretory ATPase GspE/PulE/Tfp pilus assembly ATPase PilB-like protein
LTSEADKLQLPVAAGRIARGCAECWQTGYQGRLLLAEWLSLRDAALTAAILDHHDALELERTALRGGFVPLLDRAVAAVEAGLTSPDEVRRVFGFGV